MSKYTDLEKWMVQDNPRSGHHLIGEVNGEQVWLELTKDYLNQDFKAGDVVTLDGTSYKLGNPLY